MYRSIWNNFRQSVCSFNYYNSNGIQFFRTSGFKCEGYIISDLCKDELDKSSYVKISFPECEKSSLGRSLYFDINELYDRLPPDSETRLPGVMFLPVTSEEFCNNPDVELCEQELAEIGTPVTTLSYSYRLSQLYMKTGILSSHLKVRGEDFLYIESSFETGNSGAPLINVLNGKVIGVVVDRFYSPWKNHKNLKSVINSNLRVLNDITGKWVIGNLDPVQVLSSYQQMIKHLSGEVYLSAQRNFGFAVPLKKILSSIKGLNRSACKLPFNNKNNL